MCKVDGNPADSRPISIPATQRRKKIINQHLLSEDPRPFLRAVVFSFNLFRGGEAAVSPSH